MIATLKYSEQFSEEEIIAEVVKGNTPLYEILIRRNNPYLYKIGRSFGYSHHDTQDLMQEALVKAWHALSKFENRSSFRTWVTRIMLNECYHKKQKNISRKEFYTDQNLEYKLTDMHAQQNNIISRELGRVVEKALQELPEDYRMVFVLREFNGHSTAECAELLATSESNVKTRLSRARAMLRRSIEMKYSAEEIFEFNLIYCDRIVENVMRRIVTKELVS